MFSVYYGVLYVLRTLRSIICSPYTPEFYKFSVYSGVICSPYTLEFYKFSVYSGVIYVLWILWSNICSRNNPEFYMFSVYCGVLYVLCKLRSSTCSLYILEFYVFSVVHVFCTVALHVLCILEMFSVHYVLLSSISSPYTSEISIQLKVRNLLRLREYKE